MTSAIRRLQADRRISTAEIARGTNLSANYLNERLRDEKSFTLTDMEELGQFFGFDATEFMVEANASRSNVTELRPNVGGYLDDAIKDQGYATAAGTDETQADEDE